MRNGKEPIKIKGTNGIDDLTPHRSSKLYQQDESANLVGYTNDQSSMWRAEESTLTRRKAKVTYKQMLEA